MAQSMPFIALGATLLLSTFSCCSAENVYCVRPTLAPNTSCSSCPHGDTPCATLSEYAQDAEQYFTSNTTMVFLPGDHTLDVNFTVTNISRLTLCGQPSLSHVTAVVCSGAVGFSFVSIFDFQIHFVSFTSCGRNFGSAEVSKYALLLESIQFAELVNTSFHDNLGTALVVSNTNIALADNTFTHNHCDQEGIVPGTACVGGGGISALDSILTLTGNTSFLQNGATFGSAGIHVTNCSLTSTGNIYFTDNSNTASASDETLAAAAIWASSSSLSFNGTSNFTNNFAINCGAVYIQYTTLAFTGTTNFINNSASSGNGGAIGTRYNVSLSFNGTSNFINNSGQCDYGGGGGAIFANLSSTLSFTGTSNFIGNSVEFCDGGAIYVHADTWSFTGISNFINNQASFGSGGAIYVYANTLSFTGTSNFSHNTVSLGSGGAIFVNTYASLSFNGATHVISNSLHTGGGDGGAIYAGINTSLSFTGTSSFISNSADCQPSYSGGGAIFANLNSVLNFSGTSIFIANSVDYCHGGAIYIDASILSFTGTSNFSDNTISIGSGGAIYIDASVLSFTGTSNFSDNTVSIGSGGAIYVNTNASMSFNGTTNVISNYVDLVGDGGGAIYANVNTSLSFTGTVSFINNSAASLNGGGVYLMRNSILSISPYTTVYWENNHSRLGGAIYVDDQSNPFVYCTQIDTCKAKDECFFQLPGQNLSGGIDAQLIFRNNSADVAGSVLYYGGAIDNCKLTGLDSYHSGDVFDTLVYIEDDNETSCISSDVFRVCPCEGNLIDCTKSDITFTVYPGEMIHVSMVAVGQRNGTFPTSILGHFQDVDTQPVRGSSNLQPFQYVQVADKTCTTLNYTVFSHSSLTVQANLELYASGPCSTFGDELVLQLTVRQNCPPGFSISRTEGSCVCNERLAKYTNSCDITDGLGQITRDFHQHFWVRYDPSHGLILHPHCPLDYCVPHTVQFPLNDTSVQCDHDRSGLLCGVCQVNYSLVLGTSQCKQCTNSYLLLLIPFVLMGLALVFFLLVFKLTVATGTLSGLVFYANIVGVNRTIFLRGGTTNVLSVFIAWLNLDFGFESCFYNGMDAYSKTWLQFVFPVYIWVLVGLLILVSHFSHRFAKLLGNNPVSVLATLILLSYTKILRTLTTAIHVTYLEYPSYNRKVWLYDANIDYLSGKHIPLFMVAVLVFLFLFLPYTLLLLFGQWLQATSHLRAFAWVNNSRLTPFIDSYHAPYKPKYRYWPGLLLVLRIILLLIFAFNPQENPSINLLAIQVGSGVLLVWAWISGGVYRKWYLDALESLFALNLIILAGCTYHVNLSGGNQLAIGYTSVTIALVLFIVILTYHIFLRIGSTKQCKNLNLESRLPKFKNTDAMNEPINNADEEVEDFSQLREPLLDGSPKPTYSAF